MERRYDGRINIQVALKTSARANYFYVFSKTRYFHAV